MALFQYGSTSDYINIAGQPLGQYETAHRVLAGGGNDTVHGSTYVDFLHGEAGADILYGYNGDDALIGGDGNDTLYGGNGDDSVLAGSGNDRLLGGVGNDLMYGGLGDDIYYHYAYEGVDTINDDKSEAGNTGYGGGTQDKVLMGNVSLANFAWAYGTDGDDLWLFDINDAADGAIDDGVRIEDFFLGGNNVVEIAITSDNYWLDLTSLL